jgi:hypothetical protein
MLALMQFGNFALAALAMLARTIVAKWHLGRSAGGVWVTSRTGNVTVITDRLH